MIDSQTQALLQEIMRREGRSLLMYVGDAYPWTTSRGEPALDALRRLIRTEAAAIAAFGRFLLRRQVPVEPSGSYPSNFTTHNFVALEFLLPRLADAQRGAITALERDRVAVRDAAAGAEIDKLLEAKRRSLAELERLLTPSPEPASA